MEEDPQLSAVPSPPRGRGSLRRTLLFWFLSLSLLPLTGISLISYVNTRQTLFAEKQKALITVSTMKSRQISAFFNEKLIDLRVQSENMATTQFLAALTRAFRQSGKPLSKFVGSPEWAALIGARGGELATMRKLAEYDDIFLIDATGNILFTVAREPDLGMNLFEGELSGTRFAGACREALKTGTPNFSDLEFYAPSRGAVAGFLAAAVADETGQNIGVIAFQIRGAAIDAIVHQKVGLGQTGDTHLVGPDLILRSDDLFYPDDGALKTRMDTEITRLWLAELGTTGGAAHEIALRAFVYPGPHESKRVLGASATIDIAGVQWLMIAEIEESETIAPARRLGILALVTLAVTGLLVLSISLLIANRIIRPVRDLSRVSKLAAAGNLDQRAQITTEDEIGELAASFNHMLKRIREAEETLSEQKNQLVELNEVLSARNQELDEFTYIASHDLQEPLRKLSSFCTLLERDIGDGIPENARTDMIFITDAAGRMQRLVQDLLALSRTGRAAMKRDWISLDECAERALVSLASRVQTTSAVITRDPLPYIFGDPSMMTQLYQNLIGNALKFMPPGRHPVIRLTADEKAGNMVFGVRDNGIGIKSEYVAQIFSPFKRLHGRTEYEGSGIGLAICRKTVERHGGRLWVDSWPGIGSHFKFTIDERSTGAVRVREREREDTHAENHG